MGSQIPQVITLILLGLFNSEKCCDAIELPTIKLFAAAPSFTPNQGYKPLYAGRNGELVIRPVYFDKDLAKWSEDESTTNASNTVPGNLEFICEAPYAVEWHYEGEGLTDSPFGNETDYPFNFKYASVSSARIASALNFWNASSYLFRAKIAKVFLREKLTGNYTCRSVENSRQYASWIFIYVPENAKTANNRTTSPNVLVLDKDQMIVLERNAKFVRIPCSVSDPNAKVSLYKSPNKESFQKVHLHPTSHTFDPKYGFEIQGDNYTALLGNYLCRTDNFKSVRISIVPPKDFTVMISPNQSYVPIVKGESQLFKCSSKENVTLTFSESNPVPVVNHEYNEVATFPYAAFMEVRSDIFANFARINCTTIETSDILHTWEYSEHSNQIEFKYEKGHHRVFCCADAHSPPRLRAIQCSSVMECQLKRNFAFDVPSIPSRAKEGINYPKGCTGLHWVINQGILECSLDFASKSTELINFYDFTSINPNDNNNNPSSSDVINMQHNIPLVNGKPRDILLGETFAFYCEASTRYFSTGVPSYVKFGLVKQNGWIDIIEGDFCRLNACGPADGITFDSLHINEVLCFVPLSNSSTEWRNVSLPVKVTNKMPTKIKATVMKEDGKSFTLTDIQNTDIILRDISMFKTGMLTLECDSPFEVYWSYEGSGTPIVKSGTNVTQLGDTDKSTMNVQTSIQFTEISDVITGKYICHVKDNPRLKSYFRIFVPGTNLFMNNEDKTIRITQVDMARNRDTVVIPCPISDPHETVLLFTENNKEKNTWVEVPKQKAIQYNPLIGFVVNTTEYKPWGSFFCQTEGGVSSAHIILTNPGEKLFVPTPDDSYAESSFNVAQAVKCEAKENVTLAFSGVPPTGRVIHDYNPGNEFPYSVAYFHKKASYEEERPFQRFHLINCTNVVDQTVYHTWSYIPGNRFKPALSYYYDPYKTRYVCCSNTVYPAVFRYVPCSEISECNIRKSCFSTNTNCRDQEYGTPGGANDGLDDDCVGFDVNFRPEGLLRCSVSGDYMNYNYKGFFYSHKAGYNGKADWDVSGKADSDVSASDEFMPSQYVHNNSDPTKYQIQQHPKGEIHLKSDVTFDCYGPKCAMRGLQWALIHRNGTLTYIYGFDDVGAKSKNDKETHGWTIVNFQHGNYTGIQCFARDFECGQEWTGLIFNVTFKNDAKLYFKGVIWNSNARVVHEDINF